MAEWQGSVSQMVEVSHSKVDLGVLDGVTRAETNLVVMALGFMEMRECFILCLWESKQLGDGIRQYQLAYVRNGESC